MYVGDIAELQYIETEWLPKRRTNTTNRAEMDGWNSIPTGVNRIVAITDNGRNILVKRRAIVLYTIRTGRMRVSTIEDDQVKRTRSTYGERDDTVSIEDLDAQDLNSFSDRNVLSTRISIDLQKGLVAFAWNIIVDHTYIDPLIDLTCSYSMLHGEYVIKL